MLQVLQVMIDNENETGEARRDTLQLYSCILSYDFFTLLRFWNKAFIRIGRIHKKLQNPSMNFQDAALDLKALQEHFDDDREV